MPLPPRDLSTIGPREGTRFPDIRLPDQSGATVAVLHLFADKHGGRPTVRVTLGIKELTMVDRTLPPGPSP